MSPSAVAPAAQSRHAGPASTDDHGIGAPVPRVEDRRLVTGHGLYVDDRVVSVSRTPPSFARPMPRSHGR